MAAMPTAFPFGIAAPGIVGGCITNNIALPQTTTKTIFTVAGGPIYVMQIIGRVNTAIGAVANATKLEVVPTNAPTTAVSICATADLNAAIVGTLFIPITSFATAASITVVTGVGPIAAATLFTGFYMNSGVIRINCAGSDGGTGLMSWHILYRAYGQTPPGTLQTFPTVTAALS
jgi:hypothetical protein